MDIRRNRTNNTLFAIRVKAGKFRLMDGEDIGNIRIPLDVTDRVTGQTRQGVALSGGHNSITCIR
jgi:hypothetical protein